MACCGLMPEAHLELVEAENEQKSPKSGVYVYLAVYGSSGAIHNRVC